MPGWGFGTNVANSSKKLEIVGVGGDEDSFGGVKVSLRQPVSHTGPDFMEGI